MRTRGSLSLKQNDVTIAGTGETPSSFSLVINGQIVYAQTSVPLPLVNNQKMYCRYSFCYGDDWSVTSGVSEGISQIANSRRAIKNEADEKGSLNVWNFPIEVSFQSSSPYGWPRLCLSVFSGRDVLQGYASVLLPINPGVHQKYAKMYRPVVNGNGTSWQQFIAKLTGTKNPEFEDSNITARNEGRALTRVIRSENNLTLKINLMTTRKDFQSFGYKSS